MMTIRSDTAMEKRRSTDCATDTKRRNLQQVSGHSRVSDRMATNNELRIRPRCQSVANQVGKKLRAREPTGTKPALSAWLTLLLYKHALHIKHLPGMLG